MDVPDQAQRPGRAREAPRCRGVRKNRRSRYALSRSAVPFIPHTEDDVRAMLAAIGVPSTDALFDEIPAALRGVSLDGLPRGMNEMELTRLMMGRANADGDYLTFIGAGAYEHHIPAAVWQIATRGE